MDSTFQYESMCAEILVLENLVIPPKVQKQIMKIHCKNIRLHTSNYICMYVELY